MAQSEYTRSPCAMTLSWQDGYKSKLTYKPSKLGQSDLLVGLWSEFFSKSVHAWLQVATCHSYNLCYAV